MYSTCIHCNAPLGSNEMLERFPVGRRIAYDQKTGRLWAVCRTCERWNLSPLETRWEAIEDAEKLFRATPLKVAGENIGLAQTTEGLEVVRVGAPPKIEMAAWRYGDQFGQRHRRSVRLGTALGVGLAAPGTMSILTFMGISPPPVVSMGVTLLALSAQVPILLWIRRGKPRFFLRGQSGELLRLTNQDARLAVLVPEKDGAWHLELSHDVVVRGKAERSRDRVSVRGDAAVRAISRLIPFLNWGGGSKRELSGAVAVLDEVRSTERLLRLASTNEEALKSHFKVKAGEANISVLPPRFRLALEMALHDDDEQRAMQGELAELEVRWKEADALAKIVDSLVPSPAIEAELAAIEDEVRGRAGHV